MTCQHGYPKPTMCIECIQDIGIDAPPKPLPEVDTWLRARYDGICAANPEHEIIIGDLVGYVPDEGWVCTLCGQ